MKIVSGGQTGVDRAALDIAIQLNIPHGGWCPKGRLAEDGTIPVKYALTETNSSEYSERTKLNIRDSDGTLILVPDALVKISDGTQLTKQEVAEKNKPYLIIQLNQAGNIEQIADWIKLNKIEILNIAGPRESTCPGIYQQCREFLESTLRSLTMTIAENPRPRA